MRRVLQKYKVHVYPLTVAFMICSGQCVGSSDKIDEAFKAFNAQKIIPKNKPSLKDIQSSWKSGIGYLLWHSRQESDDVTFIDNSYRILDILTKGMGIYEGLQRLEPNGMWSNNTHVSYGIRDSGPTDEEFQFMMKALYMSVLNNLMGTEEYNKDFSFYHDLVEPSLNDLISRANTLKKDRILHELLVTALYCDAVDDWIQVIGKKKINLKSKFLTVLGKKRTQLPNSSLPTTKEVQDKVTYWRNKIQEIYGVTTIELAKAYINHYQKRLGGEFSKKY